MLVWYIVLLGKIKTDFERSNQPHKWVHMHVHFCLMCLQGTATVKQRIHHDTHNGTTVVLAAAAAAINVN